MLNKVVERIRGTRVVCKEGQYRPLSIGVLAMSPICCLVLAGRGIAGVPAFDSLTVLTSPKPYY